MRLLKVMAGLTACMMLSALSAGAREGDFRQAVTLYQSGMYAQARTLFEKDGSVQGKGYAVLCAICMQTKGYEAQMNSYLAEYPYSGLAPQMLHKHALNLFDKGEYEKAAQTFAQAGQKNIHKSDRAEYYYKDAYSNYTIGNYDQAVFGYKKVDAMPLTNYSAPARYGLGYLYYSIENFTEAIPWFEKAQKDPRFAGICEYYLMECHFMLKDYDYVTSGAEKLYAQIPEQRKPHLARIISESYLVKGDAQSAKKYYDQVITEKAQTRDDYFYAGSLLYTLKDYAGAIENYTQMPDRTDSLGQIANYQMGFSYIQTKNKVAALDAFREACEVSANAEIQEDAFFNFAKLSFDLNNDPSAFKAYMAKYSDKKRGNQIYAYQALAALYAHDYAGAVAAYDNIEDLDPDMQSNYMKANYLRANQLISGGSYRSAVPCLKAAAYYSDKQTGFNQMSRYWLAEAYYRDGGYQQARSVFTELYNISALNGKYEGNVLPYNIAYCYFKEADYDNAYKWFGRYMETSDRSVRKDAMLRRGDCKFMQAQYPEAIAEYAAQAQEFSGPDNVYPLYQQGIAYGLSNDLKSKISTLEKVRTASPKADFYGDALYELGRAYVDVKEDVKAEDCYNAVLSAGSNTGASAKSLLGLGSIFRNRKDYDKSLAYYKEVVASVPNTEYSADALVAIESLYQLKQEPEGYVAYIDKLGSAAPDAAADRETLLFNGAEQVYLAGNYPKALVSLQAYEETYPQGKRISDAAFYMAECYKNTDAKDQALDYYKKAISSESSFKEAAALGYARLCYETEQFSSAFDGYSTLMGLARMPSNKHVAAVGMMNSAYKAKGMDNAILWSDNVLSDKASTADEKLQAQYIKAKALMSQSRRDEAFSIFKTLSKQPKTAQGAEAAYLLIQEAFDKGDFPAVETKTYAFSDSGSGQTYWLAKAFITLGDSFAEREDFKQARATFESVRDGYTPPSDGDDVLDAVNMRLSKLSEME